MKGRVLVTREISRGVDNILFLDLGAITWHIHFMKIHQVVVLRFVLFPIFLILE